MEYFKSLTTNNLAELIKSAKRSLLNPGENRLYEIKPGKYTPSQ